MLVIAAALALAPFLLFAGAATLVTLLRSRGYAIGYDSSLKTLVLALAALVPLGLAAALIVAFRTRTGRATSLRTRAFGVIAVVVLIPSVCLASFGVWAYFKSWDRAQALYQEQAYYRASLLNKEIRGLSASPAHFRPAERAQLSAAIVEQYGNRGQLEGASRTTLADLRAQDSLPRWAMRSLRLRGYAIGNAGGPARPGRLARDGDIVAWIGPGGQAFVYAAGWSNPSQFAAYAPLGRLFWIGAFGIAMIAVLGLLGAWILSRSVVRPVRRLAEASHRIADAGGAAEPVKPAGPRELRDLATSFNDMNAKLAKAQETEQAFLLSVSHELKTPLTSIRGYAEGIGDGTVKPPQGAAVIGAESSRLERLVGDLLDSGRMRKSAFAVRREAVDLAALVQDVALRYEGTARDAGLTLLMNTDAGGSAAADDDRLLQVVSNLVENAIRCTPSPGTVTIATAPGTVTVSDTGRGLTSDDLPRAFERFYLYSRYGTDRQVGTGLGLAIVKELTEAMGGTVSVSSAVGVGTAFTVVLPRDEAPTAVLTKDDESPTAALPRDDAS